MLPSMYGANPRMVGKPMEWSPPSTIGMTPFSRDVRHRLADLVERLLQVARDGEHVTDVDDVELLAEVDAGFVVVRAEQVRRAPDALRPEPGAGPVGGTGIQRYAEDRDLGVVDLVDVLDERALQEGAALAGEVRLLAADERRDGAVVDGGGGLETEGQPAVDLLAEAAVGEACLGLLGPGPLGVGQCGIGPVGHLSTPHAPSCRLTGVRPTDGHLVRGTGSHGPCGHCWHRREFLSSAIRSPGRCAPARRKGNAALTPGAP